MLPVAMVAPPPKSAVERSMVEGSVVERATLKRLARKLLVVERVLRDGLGDGLRWQPAGQGWGGWMQG
jgi:hypothetical protein